MCLFLPSIDKIEIGMRIRDDARCFVLANIVWFLPLCLEYIYGEVVELYIVLYWVAKLYLDNMYFVLDSKKVDDYPNTSSNDNIEFDCIMNTCKQLFQYSFQINHVEFSHKQANEID